MSEILKHYRVTWVEKGTKNAAALGLDERLKVAGVTPEMIRQAAIYHAHCDGVDLDRYEPIVELEEAV